MDKHGDKRFPATPGQREREYYLVRMVVDKKQVEHMAVDTRSAVPFFFKVTFCKKSRFFAITQLDVSYYGLRSLVCRE